MALKDSAFVKVYNYNPFILSVGDKMLDPCYNYNEPTFDSISVDQLQYINSNSSAVRNGLIRFDKNEEDDIYRELGVDKSLILKNEEIDDIILVEYGTTVVGLEMMRSVNEENAEETRKVSIVKSAISTLSFSELEAIQHIFDELDGSEGILVASKIADRVGITRSVIVNALRKFESAGVIESRSSGMKGTYIKVLNDVVFDELKKMKH